jgi:uncharacterized protein with NAD-binding domain and iron-sulfur cluster
VADYYVLALDIPGARQVVLQSEALSEPYFRDLVKLRETGVYTVALWYADSSPWKRRFPADADFFASGFRYLGVTMDLTRDGKRGRRRMAEPLLPEFQGQNISVIETQVADTEKVQALDDAAIAALVHEELKIVIPDLPRPLDWYVNRWDNYSPQRVGYEALRPPVISPLMNLLLVGDWVRTGHLSQYMEKTYVAAKMAVNAILEKCGQTEGRMQILKSGADSAIIKLCRERFSVYP